MTILHCSIYLASKYPENYVFLCKQHHIDENVSINCVIVCATRGYINAASLWGSGTCYMKCTKLMHFMLKCLVLFLMVT